MNHRALLDVSISNRENGDYLPVTSWVDTAFDGHLVLAHPLIEQLNLESLVQTDAVLADGSNVTLETYICFIEWFEKRIAVPVIANDGRFPLLGTGLLDERILLVDDVNRLLHLG